MSVIDERMRNWRTDIIAEYVRLENDIAIESHEMDTDPELNRLLKEWEKSGKMIEQGKKIYFDNISKARQQQAGIKLELVETWGDAEDKTFECPAGTATLRTNKSLNIRSKKKLIESLMQINKLSDFIKSFDITKLRKIKDAGLLEDEIATWDEKKNVAIKAEARQ